MSIPRRDPGAPPPPPLAHYPAVQLLVELGLPMFAPLHLQPLHQGLDGQALEDGGWPFRQAGASPGARPAHQAPSG